MALKDEWATQNVTYTNTNNGLELKELTKVATVYAVSVGNGNTVPIPKGFYYVGGNFDNGVIISDNPEDTYDGSTDKTTHEYAPNLKGNQFVWIPCDVSNYKKTTTYTTKLTNNTTWGTKAQNTYYDTSTNSAEKTQIEKYGGFYVGRYEAGTSDIKGISFSTITESSTDATNYTKVTGGRISSRANEIPYYHADYTTAVILSEKMYEKNQYVNSGLMTGTMWDVMINTMNEKTGCNLSNSGEWGNCYNTNKKDLRGSYCDVTLGGEHGTWKSIDDSVTFSAGTAKILSTGASNDFQKMHLYDVSGNLQEWTQETAYIKTDIEYFVVRGGSFETSSDNYPVTFRGGIGINDTYKARGFRVALYIK